MPELGETWTEQIPRIINDVEKFNEAVVESETTGKLDAEKLKAKKDTGEFIELCHTWNGVRWIDWYNDPKGCIVNITFWE